MKRFLGVVASALLLPLAAFGQANMAACGAAGMGGGNVMGGGAGYRGERVGARGVVEGTIKYVNYIHGLVRVETSGGVITLRAMPNQVADLAPGSVVRLPYVNIDNALWLTRNEGAAPQRFAQMGRLSGNVVGINKVAGMLTVATTGGERTFRAHPLAIRDLLPGEFINVGFERIGPADWAEIVRPVGMQEGGPGGSGSAGMGAGNYGGGWGGAGEGVNYGGAAMGGGGYGGCQCGAQGVNTQGGGNMQGGNSQSGGTQGNTQSGAQGGGSQGNDHGSSG